MIYLPLAKHERGLGLHVVVAGGRAADEHGGATVPTQRVLQDASHLAVPVRHVGFLEREKEREREGDVEGDSGGRGIEETAR